LIALAGALNFQDVFAHHPPLYPFLPEKYPHTSNGEGFRA